VHPAQRDPVVVSHPPPEREIHSSRRSCAEGAEGPQKPDDLHHGLQRVNVCAVQIGDRRSWFFESNTIAGDRSIIMTVRGSVTMSTPFSYACERDRRVGTQETCLQGEHKNDDDSHEKNEENRPEHQGPDPDDTPRTMEVTVSRLFGWFWRILTSRLILHD